MGWFRIDVDRNDYSCFFHVYTTGSDEAQLLTSSNGTTLAIWSHDGAVGSEVTGSALTVGAWNHLAMTHNGTNVVGYLNGVSNITNPNNPANAINTIQIGNSFLSEWLNGSIAAVKIYDAVLTADGIRREMRQHVPDRWANINGWYRLRSTADDERDFGPNGRNLTVGGSPSTTDDPLIPWRRLRRSGLYVPAAPGGGGSANLLRGKLHGGLLLGGKV